MYIDEAILAYLKAFTPLTALNSTRIYPDETPQSVDLKTQSAIIYQKISDIKVHTLTGQLELESPVFQYTVFAPTKSAAKSISDQIKVALSDFHGAMSGIEVQKIELQNETSDFTSTADGLVKVYTEDLEYQINYVKE